MTTRSVLDMTKLLVTTKTKKHKEPSTLHINSSNTLQTLRVLPTSREVSVRERSPVKWCGVLLPRLSSASGVTRHASCHVICMFYVHNNWLVVSTPLKNMKVRLDHHPSYWGK